MSRKTVLVVVAAVAVLSNGFVGVAYPGGSGFGQPDQQGATPINWEVAGTIAIVQLPLTAAVPGPGFLIDAFVKGAPGRAQFRVLSAGVGGPVNIPECEGPGQYFAYNDMVITFEDRSMLFAELDYVGGGWSCFTGKPAVANMKITGGTGRYESAEGQFQGVFDTPFMGVTGALLAETGTINGWIDR